MHSFYDPVLWVGWKAIVSSIILYFATLAIYRLSFHPLAKFPGPKLAAITRWFEAYYDVVLDGQYTFKIGRMHKKYGPILRISPNELHINDPAFFNTLYSEGRWDKDPWALDAWGAQGTTINTIEHEHHKARRQPLAPFFSKSKISARQEIIKEQVEKLCSRLIKIAREGNTVNLGAAVSALAHDVAFEFSIAKNYHSLDSEDFDVAVLHVAQGAGPMWRMTKHVFPLLPILQSIPIDWAMKISDDGTKTFFQHAKSVMNDTKTIMSAIGSATPDTNMDRTIVHEILESKLDPKEKEFKRVYLDVTATNGAGFETTGAVLRLVCFHVFSNTDILQHLRTEIANARAKEGDVMTLKVLEKLPYLTATLMEGLRLSPGIATRMTRIAPDRDLFYGDYRIPAGTHVSMTTILMHTDEELYPDPQSFKPERWMKRNVYTKAEKGFAPFSRGTRMCLGMHLAWAELYFVIAALVQTFDFEFTTARAEDFECVSDQFVIGTKGRGFLEAVVKVHEE
ncbi:trichodiene oxygenase [Hypoxylon argillaceum]|nr:trichodiene oxygenase [Hypoxylon argillaceum]